jgi:hypothetical protein
VEEAGGFEELDSNDDDDDDDDDYDDDGERELSY